MSRVTGSRLALLGLPCVLFCAGCTETTDAVGNLEPPGGEAVEPSAVDAVVYLVGDAGAAEEGRSPLMVALRDDVETWASALDDSLVMVVFLGDNVYEVGVRDSDHPDYATDTLRLNTQVRSVAGPAASEKGARAVFLPGNHDWGNEVGFEGLGRLQNMKTHLDRIDAGDTAAVALEPPPGTPGPTVMDLGARARILGLDGHWWLQSDDADERAVTMRGISLALTSAGDRHVIIASHLPLATGGPHGGTISFWSTLGMRYLAHKAGILIQDLTAAPYRDLIADFHEVFEASGPPVAMAAGHDHSLQVLTVPYDSSGASYTQLVSGSGSKFSEIRPVPGLEWGRSAPGYMRVFFLKDGSVVLHVIQGTTTTLYCGDPATRSACMAAGADSIHTAYTRRLR